MASNATDGAFQGFLVPESGLTYEYSGTTLDTEAGPVTLASGTAEASGALVASGEPTVAVGNSLWLYPVRTGAPGPEGAGYMWAEASSYSAAVSAAKWRGWDAPTMLRYTAAPDSSGSFLGSGMCVLDSTVWAWWTRTTGGVDQLRYATLTGGAWSAAATLTSRTSATVKYNPAPVTLPDGRVVVLASRSVTGSKVQVDVFPSSGSALTSVIPTAIDERAGGVLRVLGAVYSGVVLLAVVTWDGIGAYYVDQFVSYDNASTFVAVDSGAVDFIPAALVVTPSGLVVVGETVSGGTWTCGAARIGSAVISLRTIEPVDLWSARTRASGPDYSLAAFYDPVGAVHVLRQTSDPATYAADQAVSIDGGQTWQECGGGAYASGGRGWLTTRAERVVLRCSAVWLGDQAIVLATGNTSTDLLALHLGGGAESPMRTNYQHPSGSGGLYGSRPLWSASWLPIGEEPPGDLGWTTSDTGTVSRVFNNGCMTEVVQTGEASQHNLPLVSDGSEVIGRWVVSAQFGGTLDCTMRVISGDGTNYVMVEVQRTGNVWTYGTNGAPSTTTSIGTYTGTVEVIIAASRDAERARIILRPWAGTVEDQHANVSIAVSAASGGAQSAMRWRADAPSAASVSVDLYAMDVSFTANAGILCASTEPDRDPRPLSSEVPVYLGEGVSLMLYGAITGVGRYEVGTTSAYSAGNLDPVSVPSPRRYWQSGASPGFVQTITLSRDEGGQAATASHGWGSEMMGLHLEGIEGFRDIEVELYDIAVNMWRSLGIYSASATGLYWARTGQVFRPREANPSAGASLWVDHNALRLGAFETSLGAFPIVRNTSGTWIDGAVMAESRPFIVVSNEGDPDAFIGAATSGTNGVIRFPSLTVLFQPAVLGNFSAGCTQIRITVAQSAEDYQAGLNGHRLRKLVFGPVVVLPRELTRTTTRGADPNVERVTYPDGTLTITRRGPASEVIELAHSHSHAPMRYDRWSSVSTAPDYLKASGTGARPLATAEDVVGVLRGLWSDADDGARPLVWLPYIPTTMANSTQMSAGPDVGVYGVVEGSHRAAPVVGRPGYNAESTVEAFTFRRLTWERE